MRVARVSNVLLAVSAAICTLGGGALWANDLDRDREPVVLGGSVLSTLHGAIPDHIVGFRFDGSWIQIPVQVDERAVVDFGTVYNWGPSGYTFLAYTDTSSFTGPDPDSSFDANDELVFMAKDTGPQSSAGFDPANTITGSGIEVAVTNPLSAAVAYTYLYESDGSLDPGAGEQRVSYEFNLLSGPYKTTYQTVSGPNPEDSHAVTSAYSVHFSDRWIRDETRVTEGGAPGVDVLDRHKNLFGPGNCARSEDTFSNGEGAFIINHTGPLRALRAYVGANSGPTTHRIHAFYEQREDILTVLRVHAISGVMDYFDYSPDAAGMVYRNDLNTSGVVVDGVPDAVVPGPAGWEMIAGAQGSVAIVPVINTDIPDFLYTSYYSDDVTPHHTQCTGDQYEYGASGLWVDHWIPNTDPALGDYYIFEAARNLAYGPPGEGLEFGLAFASEMLNPLDVTVEPYTPSTFVASDPGHGPEPSAILLAIAPNPVDASARVRFTLPESGRLTVKLYDLRGRLAAALADGLWAAGDHEIERDLSALPAGVYFAKATGPGGTIELSRVVVLR